MNKEANLAGEFIFDSSDDFLSGPTCILGQLRFKCHLKLKASQIFIFEVNLIEIRDESLWTTVVAPFKWFGSLR
jgi:hypothetical protein